MKKRIMLLAAVVALTLPMWVVATASAGPDCERRPNHPSCDTTTTTTSTTIPGGAGTCDTGDGLEVFTETDGFVIQFEPGNAGCVDWTTTLETAWTVTVDPGRASSVYLNVRNSHPGDFCWVDTLSSRDLKSGMTSLTITHANGPLADDGPLPVSVVGACGAEFDEDDADSFVFTVGPSGKPSVVTITVTQAG